MSAFQLRKAALGMAMTAALSASLMGASRAQAGDTLFLKSATVKTSEVSASKLETAMRAGATYYVVQFKNHISPADKKNLTSLGARVVRYLPEDAYVITVEPKQIATILKSSAAINSIVPFESSWKLSADLEPGSVFSAGNVGKYLVRLFPGEKEGTTKISTVPGAKIDSASGRSISVVATRAALEAIASIEAVEWVQTYPQVTTQDFKMSADEITADPQPPGDYKDLTGYESGTRVMSFEPAWARGLDGKGQIASMADTGLDSGNVRAIHSDFTGRVPEGFIFGLYATGWEDPMGHGTHVSGSVVGAGTASGGKIHGGAYAATYIPEGMWSPMLSNLTVPTKLADLFVKSYDAGARIHTNSWGSPRNPGEYEGMAQQVDEYMAAHPDFLILFAAGNSGVDADKDGRIDPGSLGPPSTAKNCLTVGASKNLVSVGGIQKKMIELRNGADSWGVEPIASSRLSDNTTGIAAFSSRGPAKDGRTKPEIVSPGTNILSSRSHHKDAEPLWGAYNADYVWAGGTSMATPLTAGAAVVVRQYLVEDRKIAKPSSALIKAVLMHTATDLFPGQFGEVGKDKGQELLTHRPNSDEGYGLTNVDRATNLGKTLIVDEQKGLATGETHAYPVKVTATGKLTATMVYTDAPAAAEASKALVNDLDLVLVDATGHETSMNDHLNNNEIIETGVTPGTYEIRVKGTSVPQGITGGKQPYALLISVN